MSNNQGADEVLKSILNIGIDSDRTMPSDNNSSSSELASNSNSAPTDAFNEPYPKPAEKLSQIGAGGISFDFNLGVRVGIPKGKFFIRMIDLDTDAIFYEVSGENLVALSRKRHFLRTRIEIYKDNELFFTHDYDATGKKVAVILPGGTIGDSLGWFPYAKRFQKVHNCELTVLVSKPIKYLLASSYPEINFALREEFDDIKSDLYATYYLGLFFSDEDNTNQPADFRMVGLHRTAGYILGVSPEEEHAQLILSETRPIEEPYVVIATQASTQCKHWNNPKGWHDVISYLKKSGYRVICVDKQPVFGSGLHWNSIPHGAEDETGERPLLERAHWIKHADFFIGLSSGLSWLAWTVDTPVVMISGFTHPTNEFNTPYRVFSTNVCNSCWHDVRVPFQHANYLFCPRHEGTARQFECTRGITSDHVIRIIDTIPGVLRPAAEKIVAPRNV